MGITFWNIWDKKEKKAVEQESQVEIRMKMHLYLLKRGNDKNKAPTLFRK